MSLGFPGKVISEISKVIGDANKNDIIIFAAASNVGGNNTGPPIAYPARRKDVICVFSTDYQGNPSGFNPQRDENRYSFSTLGENVESAWVTADGSYRKTLSGTSVATPIAAGIAAVII
jgi:subtilisin family serine protease